MRYTIANRIYVVYLIAHTSHFTQPLDISVFSSLKRKSRALVASETVYDDYSPHEKALFMKRFAQARKAAITISNVKSGFAATGLWPYTPSKVVESRWLLSQPSERPTTPERPAIDPSSEWNIQLTPRTHAQAVQALSTIAATITVPRAVRTVVAKTSKRLEHTIFKLAVVEQEKDALVSKLADVASKNKRRQPVNVNKRFIELVDIELGSHGPPVPLQVASGNDDDDDDEVEEEENDEEDVYIPQDDMTAAIIQLYSNV